MAKTMFLPGFSHQLYGRQTAAAANQVQRRTNRLDGLAGLVARFIPEFARYGKVLTEAGIKPE